MKNERIKELVKSVNRITTRLIEGYSIDEHLDLLTLENSSKALLRAVEQGRVKNAA
jgi:hypothetical protein